MNYFDIDVGSFASPFLVDLDRDGDLDLIIGSRQGQIFHYENQGDASEGDFVLINDTLGNINLTDPIYNTAYTTPTIIDSEDGYELFIKKKKGHLYHYKDLDDNLEGSFQLVTDSMQLYSKSIKTAPALYDLNNDGWNDMLIGLYTGGVHLLFGADLNEFSTTELKIKSLNVYPNPSKGEFTISSTKLVSSIYVYSLSGKEVLRNYNSSTFNLSGLTAGLYFVKALFEDETIQYTKVSLIK